jgi:hypothetical protein
MTSTSTTHPPGSPAPHRQILRAGYHSPSVSSASEDEDGTSSSPVLPSRSIGALREAQLNRDLDFSKRYETVEFKETPFTIAAILSGRGRSQSTDGSADSQENKTRSKPRGIDGAWTVIGGKGRDGGGKANGKSKGSMGAAGQKKVGGNLRVANPDPGGRRDSTRLQGEDKAKGRKPKSDARKDAEVETKPRPSAASSGRNNFGGWQVRGAPIRLVQTKKGTSAKTTGKGKGTKVDDQVEESGSKQSSMAKALARKRSSSTKSRKVQSEDNGKITFTRIRKTMSACLTY